MKDQDIHRVVAVLKQEIKQWKVPIVGHYTPDPFKVLISCVLSLRTQDKTTEGASRRLFALAGAPRRMLTLSVRRIEKAIYPVGFYRTKARNILKICAILMEQYRGKVPDTMEGLLALPGVGRKTANLVLTIGFDKMGICVDTHVHRIFNRWGYVRTQSPEETEFALRKKLPPRYWKIINDILVTFGQNFCKPISPWCSRCRIARYCRRNGVGKRR